MIGVQIFLYRSDETPWSLEYILNIGLELETIVLKANHATEGLILTSFISIVLFLVGVSFGIITILGFNDTTAGNLKVMHAAAASITTLMFWFRFYRLMNSGERLWKKVNKSKRKLENIILLDDCMEIREKDRQKMSVLQKRLDVYQYLSPISPYSAFGLNNKTFFATLTTVISYVVILIKLRGVDKSQSINSRVNNDTIRI